MIEIYDCNATDFGSVRTVGVSYWYTNSYGKLCDCYDVILSGADGRIVDNPIEPDWPFRWSDVMRTILDWFSPAGEGRP